MILGRLLKRGEIKGIWQIDRSEQVESVYFLLDGKLTLRPEHHDVKGWPAGQPEHDTPLLKACFERGGWFYGLFNEQTLMGVVVLESRFMGANQDQLQLRFLHVSHAFRDQGLGRSLFNEAAREALRRGAKSLYVSATESEHTVNFYLRLGCTLARVPDATLFAAEPNDIHLEYDLRMIKS